MDDHNNWLRVRSQVQLVLVLNILLSQWNAVYGKLHRYTHVTRHANIARDLCAVYTRRSSRRSVARPIATIASYKHRVILRSVVLNSLRNSTVEPNVKLKVKHITEDAKNEMSSQEFIASNPPWTSTSAVAAVDKWINFHFDRGR